jgi:hypothetical protein
VARPANELWQLAMGQFLPVNNVDDVSVVSPIAAKSLRCDTCRRGPISAMAPRDGDADALLSQIR